MLSKITDKGYWVSRHYYWQSMMHYLWQSLKYRSFSYFSICNPLIHFGGMLDDEKTQVYQLIDQRYLPVTIPINSIEDIDATQLGSSFGFPFILKPDIGFKGYQVHLIRNQDMLAQIKETLDYTQTWIAQEYIDYSREFSILYHRSPHTDRGVVSSFIEKKYPFVMGDGVTDLRQLITQYKSPFINKNQLFSDYASRLDSILKEGEQLILHRIGNYSRGSKFYSLQHEIDTQLSSEMDRFHNTTKEIDFFRIDCKADSIDALRQGEYKIIELNGMKAEPLHIYDPEMSFRRNTKSIYKHWQYVDDLVAAKRKSMDFKLPSTYEGWQALQHTRRLVP